MKPTILLFICALFFACNSEKQPKQSELADVNLIIQTDKKVDSVWISNIGQTESFFVPYADTIKVDFDATLDDLYNINFFTENGVLSNQIWLNGGPVIIRGTIIEKFEIDTVLNSDLYYEAVNYSKKYRELIQNKADSTTIDEFLIDHIGKNITSPISLAISNAFIYRNQNKKDKIRVLFDLLEPQNDSLKNHFISIHGKIANILNVSSLNTSDYTLANLEDKPTKMEKEKSQTQLLDFWFINCPPCIKDHKLIATKLDFLKEKNVELIGISTDQSHAKWKEYLQTHQYNWKNYREIDSLQRMTKDMAIWSYPTYLLLDENGEIQARFNSFEDFEKNLDSQ